MSAYRGTEESAVGISVREVQQRAAGELIDGYCFERRQPGRTLPQLPRFGMRVAQGLRRVRSLFEYPDLFLYAARSGEVLVPTLSVVSSGTRHPFRNRLSILNQPIISTILRELVYPYLYR